MTRQQIEEQIESAINRAVPKHIVDQFEFEERELLRAYLDNQLSTKELLDKLSQLEKDLPFIYFYSLQEIKVAVEYLNFTQQQMYESIGEDLLNHQLLENDLPRRYGLIFYHSPEGRLATYVFTQKHFLATMNRQIRNIALKRINEPSIPHIA